MALCAQSSIIPAEQKDPYARDFDELLKRVGEQDLTAHVDFSQLCSEAEQAGFQVNGLVTQARFLINVGILESAQNILDQTTDTISRTRHQQALHQLLSEPEMGERFKVMLLTKNLDSARRQTLIEKGFCRRCSIRASRTTSAMLPA
ncbi:MAG: hypothetical protein RLZZ140_1105 [Pseudomonadota bacterium]